MDWLHQVTTLLGDRTGLDTGSLELDGPTRRKILDVARIASHASGERIYAPLLCYILGTMSARGVSLDDAIAAVKEHTGDVD